MCRIVIYLNEVIIDRSQLCDFSVDSVQMVVSAVSDGVIRFNSSFFKFIKHINHICSSEEQD